MHHKYTVEIDDDAQEFIVTCVDCKQVHRSHSSEGLLKFLADHFDDPMPEDTRWWSWYMDSPHRHDLERWLERNELMYLVDEECGGIVGYIHNAHVDYIVEVLNKEHRSGTA